MSQYHIYGRFIHKQFIDKQLILEIEAYSNNKLQSICILKFRRPLSHLAVHLAHSLCLCGHQNVNVLLFSLLRRAVSSQYLILYIRNNHYPLLKASQNNLTYNSIIKISQTSHRYPIVADGHGYIHSLKSQLSD